MEFIKYPQKADWSKLCKRPTKETKSLIESIETILSSVKKEGDAALRSFCQKFDGYAPDNFRVSEAEINESENKISPLLKQAIEQARRNISTFHTEQLLEEKRIQTTSGVFCWQKQTPIEKVGLYIPGGSAPLFSTVLMLGIPAKIAECNEIIICTPANKNGEIHPAILYAAKAIGIRKIFKIGGAQAIAAMAYGTESIPKVYKIFGPGNQYVTTAKQLVSLNDVAIDMPAGPSEVAIIADAGANPIFVAADMLSQAEHGTDSQSILITDCEQLANDVITEIEQQLEALSRNEIAKKSLAHSKIILVKDLEEAVHFSNEYAPEHLILAVRNDESIAECITNAGSVFLGDYSPESAGDYASGTNHTLPTNGYAKMYSGVNIDSFTRKITFQKITRDGLKNIGNAIEIMAENEGLTAHKNAVTLRLDYDENDL